ncbi:DMT family transporter [Streptomyces winkii]|uniref:DMT family transporter n=1 Tax=Streptomyces winkii TaxID=3051178 RepID=UPI0028D44EDB|nr:DMT family transporter [Streptomyces sp. DSM 40971]
MTQNADGTQSTDAAQNADGTRDADATQGNAGAAAPARGSGRSRLLGGAVVGSLGVLCFSGTAPVSRIAAPVFGSGTLTAARILIAAALGVATLAATRRLRWPGRRWLPGLLIAGLGQAVGYPLFLALAVERVPAHHGAVVVGLLPAATAVLAAIRGGERPAARFWAACAIGLCAVIAFAIVQGGGSLHAADGWLVAAVLSAAVGYVEGARVARGIGAVATVCWAMILLAPACAVALVVLFPVQAAGSAAPSAWACLAYAGVASMFLGSLAWLYGLAAGGTARVGQLNLAQPFLAITWSGLLLAERITWAVPVTAAVVLGCMAVCLNTRPDAGVPRADGTH